MRTKTFALLLALASGFACGSAPSGPSVVAAPPTPAPYVYTVDRWQVGLAMRHCFGPGIDAVVAQWAADEMTAASGVPQASGPCNVEWILDTSIGVEGSTAKTQDGLATTHAVLRFRNTNAMYYDAVHEGGHVLGLAHSTDRDDVMFAPGASNVRTFSANERALLNAIYKVR